MQIYIVKPSDTVNMIATNFGISAEWIIYDNQLEYPYPLAIGQALYIRTPGGIGQKTDIVSNGYAYPFIEQTVLTETLPFLSELSIFSYGFTRNGDLLPPMVDDFRLIAEATVRNTKPILTLTPLDEEGNFSNYLINQVINNEAAVLNLIEQLIQIVKCRGFAGVDIDFEYILAQDRDTFTVFVKNVTNALNTYGYQVSVALAPKTSGDQTGTLYEGKDYAGLGAVANHVLLMTYEWGYTYGPPMAVAPINKVREVVEYAITQIPIRKINLGIPNYGYDWPLPFIQGVTAAKTIGTVEATQLAIRHGSVIQYDEVAQSPFFEYTENGIEHVVWFEDVRSMRAKFDLIKEYGLRGAGYWQIMKLFRANWLLMQDLFVIRR